MFVLIFSLNKTISEHDSILMCVEITVMQSGGYWGRGGMDPEPGRCRRTDGKKWRCSRDVVSGYKYCERHMHRGRNRSRKPVEIPTAPVAANDNTNRHLAAQIPTATPFRLSGPSHSFDLLPLKQRYPQATLVLFHFYVVVCVSCYILLKPRGSNWKLL